MEKVVNQILRNKNDPSFSYQIQRKDTGIANLTQISLRNLAYAV